MSILIQFINDHIVLFVFTIIAVIVLIGAVAALIAFHLIQKRKSKIAANAVDKRTNAQRQERKHNRRP